MNGQSSKILCPGTLTPASTRAVGTALDQIAYGILCALVFALPWEGAILPSIMPWLGLASFGVTLLRTVVLEQARRLCELHYWMLAFAVWSSASIVWTLDLDSTAVRVATYPQLLLLAWIIWVLADNEARVLTLVQFYVLGTYVTAIGTIANTIAGRTFERFNDIEGPAGQRYMINGMNPNYTGLLLVPGILMSLFLLARRKANPLTTLLCWVQLVLCITTIFLSGSRGALLAAAPAIVMFPLVVVRLPCWQRILAVVAIGAAAACGALLVPSETWQRISQLGTEVTSGTMTHRTEIWRAGLELFRDHPFLGVGANAHAAVIVGIIGRPLVAHNTFLSVLVELGVVGELVLLVLLGAALYCVLQMPGLERALWILTLAAWGIGACSATTEYLKVTWFLLSLLAAHAHVRRDATPRALYSCDL